VDDDRAHSRPCDEPIIISSKQPLLTPLTLCCDHLEQRTERLRASTALGSGQKRPWCRWSSWAAGLKDALVKMGSRTGRRNGLTLVNVGQDTTLCDCDVAEQLVQLLIVADGELEMTGDDTGLLVVACSVTGQFEDFSSQVFEHSCEVDRGT
jgi:hypothetical protein